MDTGKREEMDNNVQLSTFNEQRSSAYAFAADEEVLWVLGEQEGRYNLEDRLLEYSVRVVRLCESFPNTRAGNHVGGQLLRCGTSPLANHGEAQAAASRGDFIHKLSLCLKELKECRRWIRLAYRVPLSDPPAKIEPLLQETEELIRIFSASLKTARSGQRPAER